MITFHIKRNYLENKLELLGVNEKLVDKILKSQLLTLKRKRFKTSERQQRKNNSNSKDLNNGISKRSVNNFLKKQANLIGKKKDPYDL